MKLLSILLIVIGIFYTGSVIAGIVLISANEILLIHGGLAILIIMIGVVALMLHQNKFQR